MVPMKFHVQTKYPCCRCTYAHWHLQHKGNHARVRAHVICRVTINEIIENRNFKTRQKGPYVIEVPSEDGIAIETVCPFREPADPTICNHCGQFHPPDEMACKLPPICPDCADKVSNGRSPIQWEIIEVKK